MRRSLASIPHGIGIFRMLTLIVGVAVLAGSTKLATAATTATATNLPTYRINVAPYTTEAADPTKCYQYMWLKFHSPTTPWSTQSRMLHVNGTGSDVRDEWWIALDHKFVSGVDGPGIRSVLETCELARYM